MSQTLIAALISGSVSVVSSLIVFAAFFGGVIERIKALERHIDRTVTRVEFERLVTEIKGLRKDLMNILLRER